MSCYSQVITSSWPVAKFNHVYLNLHFQKLLLNFIIISIFLLLLNKQKKNPLLVETSSPQVFSILRVSTSPICFQPERGSQKSHHIILTGFIGKPKGTKLKITDWKQCGLAVKKWVRMPCPSANPSTYTQPLSPTHGSSFLLMQSPGSSSNSSSSWAPLRMTCTSLLAPAWLGSSRGRQWESETGDQSSHSYSVCSPLKEITKRAWGHI